MLWLDFYHKNILKFFVSEKRKAMTIKSFLYFRECLACLVPCLYHLGSIDFLVLGCANISTDHN